MEKFFVPLKFHPILTSKTQPGSKMVSANLGFSPSKFLSKNYSHVGLDTAIHTPRGGRGQQMQTHTHTRIFKMEFTVILSI